jgi:Cu/Zn superoxide dismutase
MGLFGTALLAVNKPITVAMKDGTGRDVGTAKISDGPGGKGVKIALDLKNLAPIEHAIHIPLGSQM